MLDRRAALLLLSAAPLAACATSQADLQGSAADTPPTRAGVVFLFPGLTLPGDSYINTGTHKMMQQIRAKGVRAEINYAGEWEQVATRFIAATPDAAKLPIAVIGYSYGARSAIDLARRLGDNGIPVQTVVVLEATDPAPVPANVARALHLYVGDGMFSWANKITQAEDFKGSLENVALANRLPNGSQLDHWSVSRIDAVYALVLGEILDGDGVRWRWPKPEPEKPLPRTARRR